ncbi:MAG TPA: thioredoxin domain-containing protein [Fibrobacteraceae bacterium]|nr:thioredoxin domain-containing protein [Fibrobacteraceae bacterium]
MKKMAFLLLPLLFVSVSCNNVPQGAAGIGDLRAKYDSLSTVVAKMNEEFDILKKGLEKRGLSLDQIRAEIEAENKVWDIPIDNSAILGNPNAPITIVEFSDFQCPYCSRVAPILDSLMLKHPKELRMIYKFFPLPFHKNAPAAAAAAIAAQAQGKFWEFRFAIASHNKELSEETFLKVAKEIGLNVEKFKKDMPLDASKQARIDGDIKLGQGIGVQGTPNFYVNGKRIDRFSVDLVEKMISELK